MVHLRWFFTMQFKSNRIIPIRFHKVLIFIIACVCVCIECWVLSPFRALAHSLNAISILTTMKKKSFSAFLKIITFNYYYFFFCFLFHSSVEMFQFIRKFRNKNKKININHRKRISNGALWLINEWNWLIILWLVWFWLDADPVVNSHKLSPLMST